MKTSMWWAWAIKNSVSIVSWVILAILFDKWWVALFALLFASSVEHTESQGPKGDTGPMGPKGDPGDDGLPKVDSSMEGYFLRVVDGVWTAASIENKGDIE